MAYTRIHAIKTTLNKAIDYIENPEKTEEQLLVSGYNIDPLSASIEFEMTAAMAREIKGDYRKTGGADIQAFHMIQSFSPDDKLTEQQAHEIGKKWADSILQGKYEYVISTHVDKGHIHNHIIFNSVSFYDYKKYETIPYKTAALLRKESDRICQEYGLSVIKNPNLKQKSKSHFEWEQNQKGTSWKAQIKNSIDKAIEKCSTYEDFQKALLEDGIEILDGERITFHKIGIVSKNGRAGKCRGDRIGADYTKERIIERLQAPKKKKREKVYRDEPKKKQGQGVDRSPVFASFDKKVEWEARKTKLANTKELAAALLTIRQEQIQSEPDFAIHIQQLSDKVLEVKGAVKQLNQKNQQYKEAAKYLLAFQQYLPIKQGVANQTFLTKKKYLARYESELAAFDHAAIQLERMGVNSSVDPQKVLVMVKEHDGQIKSLSDQIENLSKKLEQIKQARDLVNRVMSKDAEREPEREQEQQRRNRGSEER